MIHDWQTYFGDAYTLGDHAARNPNGMLERDAPPAGVDVTVTTTARVSGSCWIADCPKPGCGGAEFVNFGDPRFFCCNCRNADWGGQAIRVVVPDDETKTAVEDVLLARPDPKTRNWTDAETAADLEAENVANNAAVELDR